MSEKIVYLVIDTGWESSSVEAVYQSRELAEAHIRAENARAVKAYSKPNLWIQEQPVRTAYLSGIRA